MHYDDVQEVLYQNMKLMGPGSGVQVVEWTQFGHIVKMFLILEDFFLNFHIYLR